MESSTNDATEGISDAQGVKARAKKGFVARISETINNAMRFFFFRLAYYIARNPWKVIIISIIAALVTLVGLVRFREEDEDFRLWVPQGISVLDNRFFVVSNFRDATGDVSQILVLDQDESEGDIGNKDALLDMIQLARVAQGVELEPFEGDETAPSFEDICVRVADNAGNELCLTSSPLNLFYEPPENADGVVDFLSVVEANVNAASDAEIEEKLLSGELPSLSPSISVLAKDLISIKDGKVIAMVYEMSTFDRYTPVFEVAASEALIDNRDDISTRQVRWEFLSEETASLAFEESLTGDLSTFAIGLVLLVIYVILFLGEFHTIQSRMVLGLIAILNCGLALAVTFGLSSLFGMFYGPVHNIIALLIIGVGVDDIMVITKALNDINRKTSATEPKSREVRIATAVSTAGPAITITSLTNFLVFLVSGVASLPALRFFALWSAIGVLAAYVFSVTFFVGALTLDQRRIDNNRRDCCSCCKPVQSPKPRNWFGREFGVFNRFFGNFYGPLLVKTPVRIAVLIAFFGLLAASIWACTQVSILYRYYFFFPDGTAPKDFSIEFERNFEASVSFAVYVRDVDLSTAEAQQDMLELCDETDGLVAKNEWVEEGSVSCWYSALRSSLNLADGEYVPAGEFEETVTTFLESADGASFVSDFALSEEEIAKGPSRATRFRGLYRYAETNQQEVDRLVSLRSTLEESDFTDEQVLTYSDADVDAETSRGLRKEIGLSLGLACASVLVICFVLIGNPFAAILCALVVGMVVTVEYGFLYFTGYNLNVTSSIILAIAVGLTVDYVAHIVRAFLEHTGTRSERAVKALEELGPAVFHAGFSTFLAIVLLAAANAYVFQVFFAGFAILIGFGMLHGLMFAPVLLSFIGPPSLYASEEDKEHAESALEQRVLASAGVAPNNEPAAAENA